MVAVGLLLIVLLQQSHLTRGQQSSSRSFSTRILEEAAAECVYDASAFYTCITEKLPAESHDECARCFESAQSSSSQEFLVEPLGDCDSSVKLFCEPLLECKCLAPCTPEFSTLTDCALKSALDTLNRTSFTGCTVDCSTVSEENESQNSTTSTSGSVGPSFSPTTAFSTGVAMMMFSAILS